MTVHSVESTANWRLSRLEIDHGLSAALPITGPLNRFRRANWWNRIEFRRRVETWFQFAIATRGGFFVENKGLAGQLEFPHLILMKSAAGLHNCESEL